MTTSTPILELQGIWKHFPGVQALQDVSFAVCPGEIHALIGENGAGKSTLLKIIFGAQPPDRGTIKVNGEDVVLRSPSDALHRGISMVHQELSLVPQLTAVQNIVLGRERSTVGVIDWSAARREAEAALKKLRFRANPSIPVRRLSVAQQQVVELARAVAIDAKVIILDEPTASLSVEESQTLFQILRELRADGHSLIYVSHRLAEVFDLADRVTVLRDGKLVGTLTRGPELTERALVRMMVGRQLEDMPAATQDHSGEEVLRVEGLTRKGAFEDINLTLHRGEIVGVAGMVGAGRTEVARGIVGADRIDKGAIYVRGRAAHIHSPADAIKAGIAFLTEDRKNQGLVLGMSVASNTTLPALKTQWGWLSRRAQRSVARPVLEQVGATMPPSRVTRQLSGGNQQKVVLARWLLTKSDVFIFDEPTRGIDVGAKAEIYQLMRSLADQGAGILMISSELPEILRMSDRVLVMRAGHIVAELPRAEASEETVVSHASGGEQ